MPLRSLDVDAPDDDLRALMPLLSDVRVLGMGEATHGTAEFFRLKHRLLRFLVARMGFTTLAMEASSSASQAVNDYVLHGSGDAASVVAGLGFWTWRTHEMLAVVNWMREHNRTAPPGRTVQFIGIDPQRWRTSRRDLLPRASTARPKARRAAY
ncbi:erythromycin esterase family protein [Streptomyces sp. NPDC054765]